MTYQVVLYAVVGQVMSYRTFIFAPSLTYQRFWETDAVQSVGEMRKRTPYDLMGVRPSFATNHS